VAVDGSGNEIARNTAVGTGNLKTFTLTLPTGQGYRFFLIENEGTGYERVYSLSYGGDNVFNISSGITLDLGFVDISSGVAVPENSPIVEGVSTSSGSTSVPSFLAGSAFTTADLQGTWNVHGITKGDSPDDWVGWTYGTVDLDDSGNAIISTAGSHETYVTDAPFDNAFATGPSGTVSSTIYPYFNGMMSIDKNLIIATSDNLVGDDNLLVLQKTGDVTYATSDLEGSWNIHMITAGEDLSDWIGWAYGTFDMASTGNTTNVSIIRSDDSTISSLGTFDISSSGTINNIDFTKFNGFMSVDKNLIVATCDDDGGGYDLIIFQRIGDTNFVLSDLQGTWNGHSLIVGDTPDDPVGWEYQSYTIDNSGYISNMSIMESNGNHDVMTSSLGPLAISPGGEISTNFVGNFNGVLSIEKNLMVATYDDDIGSHFFVSIK
jgi:hypothetical protein